MAVTLNALTTGVGGLQTTADTSGQISLQSNGSTVVAVTASGAAVTGTMTVGGSSVLTSASATVGAGGITFSDGSTQTAAASPYVLKNRIINGDMRIDQRNAGASIVIVNAYSADRWRVENSTSGTATVQQVSDAPTGFSSSIKYTVTSVDSSLSSTECAFIQQAIEGFNFSDMLYGTANAKTVTLSFWVKSSVTGTFGATLANNAYNRGYPASFTVNTANTWEQKTATITGDTTGTWIGDTNGIGVRVSFGMAAGSDRASASGAWAAAVVLGVNSQVNLMATNGATFQVTGVQLEQNTSATPFERRLYGQELANCQRYFVELYGGTNAYQPLGLGNTYTTTLGSYCIYLPVPMRTVPSLTTNGAIYFQNLGNINISSFAGPYSQKGTIVEGDFTMSSAVTADRASFMRFNNVNTSTAKFNYSAEL